MTAAEVRRLLGPPDDIRTQHDPGGISAVGVKEIWRYGTSGHLTTPTLGVVCIDEKDRVQYVSGKGEPRVKSLPEERELAGCSTSWAKSPRTMRARTTIPARSSALNALLPLGKDKALATIDEFLRVTSHGYDNGGEACSWCCVRCLMCPAIRATCRL